MRLSYLLGLSMALVATVVTAFIPQQILPRRVSSSSLWLAKPRGKTGGSSSNSMGGGFGSPVSTSASSDHGKVRSVSGFTGSGTKPLRVAANTFDQLRKTYGPECTSDVYVRSPLNDATLFWFVGKIARCLQHDKLQGGSIPTEQEAVVSQKRLILEYAKRQLRPQNMGGPYAKALEVWLAPGDSEMDVVQNKVILQKVEGALSNISETFAVADVGFNPEIYLGDELQKGGLRVVRDEQGRPVKPVFDVNESA